MSPISPVIVLVVCVVLAAIQSSQAGSDPQYCRVHDMQALRVNLRQFRTEVEEYKHARDKEFNNYKDAKDKEFTAYRDAKEQEFTAYKDATAQTLKEREEEFQYYKYSAAQTFATAGKLKESDEEFQDYKNEASATIEELKTKLITTTNELGQLKAHLTQAVGFSARQPLISTTKENQMAFSHVLTNERGAFTANTGVFTCPVAGMYYFSVVLLKDHDFEGYATCYILKNGAPLVKAYTQPGHDPQTGYYTAVAAVYTQLTVGDTVTLGVCSIPITSVFNEESSFSGFLVMADV